MLSCNANNGVFEVFQALGNIRSVSYLKLNAELAETLSCEWSLGAEYYYLRLGRINYSCF